VSDIVSRQLMASSSPPSISFSNPLPHPDNPNMAPLKARHTYVPSPDCCHSFCPHNSSCPLPRTTHPLSTRASLFYSLFHIFSNSTLLLSSSLLIPVSAEQRRSSGSRAKVTGGPQPAWCDLLTQSILHLYCTHISDSIAPLHAGLAHLSLPHDHFSFPPPVHL
jgi:hypothetical protein